MSEPPDPDLNQDARPLGRYISLLQRPFLLWFFFILITMVGLELLLFFISNAWGLHLGLFIFAGGMVSILLVFILWFFLLNPLFRLRNKLEALSSNISHPEHYLTIPRYHGAINDIIVKVNELLRKLADVYKNLKAHASILELRIEERTKELQQLANYDIVTELPNRNLLKESLSQAIVAAELDNKIAAVYILDLLNFHEITNALGHNIGNLFLKEVGKYLTDSLPAQVIIAHTDTTQFAIASCSLNNTSQISSLAQWIVDLFSKPLSIANHNVLTVINLGVTVFPHDGKDAESLIINAHLALNRAKGKGPNVIQFYEANMNQAIETRRSTLVDLHYALEKKQFVLYYQPQVDLKTRKIIGAESLIRWQHPEKGLISPDLFIPLAEESGLIVSIGEWALRTLCEQIKTWQQAGLPELIFAANLSGVQFLQKGIIETVSKILHTSGINPALLELEITESAIMQDMEGAIALMKALRAIGCPLAMDDFGTGYSSLSCVSRFPIQKIKIDQSFVREIRGDEPSEKHLADIIIQLGKNLNMRVIAEGIETEAQAQYLQEKGCDEGQGYLFGRPETDDKFIALVKTHHK